MECTVELCTHDMFDAFSGQWKDGQAHGPGKEINPDGSVRHDGEWSYDRPVRDSQGER